MPLFANYSVIYGRFRGSKITAVAAITATTEKAIKFQLVAIPKLAIYAPNIGPVIAPIREKLNAQPVAEARAFDG